MSAFLRVDDFPGTKTEEFWKHNLDNFKRFDEVVSRHVDEYVLGVVPKYTTSEHLEYLSSNEKVVVALHGVEHDERFQNEFRDFETENQVYQKVMSAKEPLRSCNGNGEVRVYIPPHNCIDRKTVNALKRAGFSSVLGGPGSEENVLNYAAANGMNVWNSVHPTWYGRSDELLHRDNSVEVISKANPSGNFCLTLHWTWEWNIGLENLEAYLKEVAPFLKGYNAPR